MDLRNMRQLLAVRTHGSFAKASQALGMSQPSLSAAISRMEDQLRVKLFERTATGSALTPIGELIADRADKVLTETDRIVRDAELVAGGEAGSIRLGIGTSLRHDFMPRFVLAIAERHPSLGLCVEMLDRDRLLPLVKSRELDLAICAFGDDIAQEGLLATEVLTTRAVAVVRPDHPLAGERSVTAGRFAEFAAGGAGLAEFNNTSVLKVLGDDAEALSRYQSNDYDVLLELALAGRATLVAPLFVVQPHVDAGRLALVDLALDYRVSFAAVTTRAASYSPILSRLIRQAETTGRAIQA